MSKEVEKRIESLKYLLAATAASMIPGSASAQRGNPNTIVEKHDSVVQVAKTENKRKYHASDLEKVDLEALGLNTLESFTVNPKAVFDEEMALSLCEGETSEKIADAFGAGDKYNKDGRHCWRGVKAIGEAAGLMNFKDGSESAYMAVDAAKRCGMFVEINLNENYDLLEFLPEGTLVIQDRGKNGEAKNGHVFFIKQIVDDDGKVTSVQDCGQGKRYSNLPKSGERRVRIKIKKGKGYATVSKIEHYGKLHVFVPGDCSIAQEDVLKLVEKGVLEVAPAAEETLRNYFGSKNNEKTLRLTPAMFKNRQSVNS